MEHQIFCADCLEILPGFGDGSFDLVIADPPYFKVAKEKWDYLWRTERDYLGWCAGWLTEIARVLRSGGTLHLFGYFRTLCLLVPILSDMGFRLRQQIVIDKGMRSVAGRATKNYRMFPNVTESILFLVRDNIGFARDLLKRRQGELGLSAREINRRLGVKTNGGGMWSIYAGDNVCGQFPTRELWEKLEEILEFDVPYEKIAQTFNPAMGLTDVWTDIDFYAEKRLHPTQKPLKLMERLVTACSNAGDRVLDPFGGSGATLIACEELGRNCAIIEKSPEYFKAMDERLKGFPKSCRPS